MNATNRTRLRGRFRRISLLLAALLTALGGFALDHHRRSGRGFEERVEVTTVIRLTSGRGYVGKSWATHALVSELIRDCLVLPIPPDDGCSCMSYANSSHTTDGMRNTTGSTAAPRIVWCLGGSTTACWEVPDDMTWPSALQLQLGSEWEVLNMGVAGATSGAELARLGHELTRRPKPEVVIVYDGVNDVYVSGLQPAISTRVALWQRNHALMQAYCALAGVRLVEVVQATRGTSGGEDGFGAAEGLEALVATKTGVDGRRIMPGPDVYVDWCHCNDDGNRAIARFVAPLIYCDGYQSQYTR